MAQVQLPADMASVVIDLWRRSVSDRRSQFALWGAGNCLIYLALLLGVPTFPVFVGLFFITFLAHQPHKVLSPLTVLYIYYGAWFIFAPAVASLYIGVLDLVEYRMAFALAYSVFSTAVVSLVLGEALGLSSTRNLIRLPDISPAGLTTIIGALYVIASLSILGIIMRSGGLGPWLDNPGDAFLNRGGSGVFVVISHFSSLALAAATAYIAYRGRQWSLLLCFIAWVLVTSPVHGSKLQIGLLLLVAVMPWLVSSRFWSWKLAALLIGGVVIFLGGMFLRHQSILSSLGMVLSTANYFTALQNLAMSLRDFPTDFLSTFLLPFNKIGMLLGLQDSSAYFDMNHFLTDMYYPERWAMKATEQWPVETDLYLNFGFALGLPIIFVFFFLHGWLYGFAQKTNSVGAWFAVVMVVVGMISHLRGSLYNHVDFYMYPYIAVMFILMSGWQLFPDRSTNIGHYKTI